MLKIIVPQKRKIGSDDSMNQFIYKALNDKELNDGEFRLYSLIKELGNNNAGYCYATNSYLAKVLGKHEKSISRLIGPLIEKGYLYMIALEKGNAVEERRLYAEESYKTYLEDLESYESKKAMKTYCLKEKTEDGDETTVTVNERNYKEYTGNKNATGNKNVTGTGNKFEDGTGNNIVTENIYNINNNNINIEEDEELGNDPLGRANYFLDSVIKNHDLEVNEMAKEVLMKEHYTKLIKYDMKRLKAILKKIYEVRFIHEGMRKKNGNDRNFLVWIVKNIALIEIDQFQDYQKKDGKKNGKFTGNSREKPNKGWGQFN